MAEERLTPEGYLPRVVDEQVELGIGEHCSEHSIPEEWDSRLGEYLNELFTYPRAPLRT